MLIKLYANEILAGAITIDDVPAKLKAGVIAYLESIAPTA